MYNVPLALGANEMCGIYGKSEIGMVFFFLVESNGK